MSLIPWRNKAGGNGNGSLSHVAELRTEMDRLFDSFLRDPFAGMGDGFGQLKAWAPALDIAEDEKEVTVRAEVPGVDPKDLDLTVQGDQLVISGEKKESSEKKDKDFYHVESRYGSFRRSVQLPPGTDSQNVTADYANGVLTVKLQKTPAVAPKKVEVKVS